MEVLDGMPQIEDPSAGRQPLPDALQGCGQMVDLEVKKADQHQVDQPFRLPLGRVADLPVDSLVPVTRPCQIDRHRRVVDRSHRPTLPSHPPRVTAVAAGQIDRGARSQIGNSCCDGSRRVDSPWLRHRSVSLVPVACVHDCSPISVSPFQIGRCPQQHREPSNVTDRYPWGYTGDGQEYPHPYQE